MNGSTRQHDWDTAEIVEVSRPTCPTCGSEAYTPIRGYADGDGVRTSRRVCGNKKKPGCGIAYVVISEPKLPSFGRE